MDSLDVPLSKSDEKPRAEKILPLIKGDPPVAGLCHNYCKTSSSIMIASAARLERTTEKVITDVHHASNLGVPALR